MSKLLTGTVYTYNACVRLVYASEIHYYFWIFTAPPLEGVDLMWDVSNGSTLIVSTPISTPFFRLHMCKPRAVLRLGTGGHIWAGGGFVNSIFGQ